MITSKSCSVCHITKKVKSYYIHRDNKQGYGLNNACRDCDNKTAINLEGIKKYCDINCRLFSQELYDFVVKSITKKYKDDVDYNSLSEEKRELFFNTKVMKGYFSQQGQRQFYQYLNTNESDTSVEEIEREEDIDEELERTKPVKESKIHSEKWGGTYSKAQISWLDSYYADTCADFNVISRIHKDYAKKIAKSSLNMDEAFSDMMNGVSGADKRYKEAKAVFDSLSISAKFSEKTRSNNDTAGMGSLSEIGAWLEQNGFLQKKIIFEEDDVDKINSDLRHVLASISGDV